MITVDSTKNRNILTNYQQQQQQQQPDSSRGRCPRLVQSYSSLHDGPSSDTDTDSVIGVNATDDVVVVDNDTLAHDAEDDADDDRSNNNIETIQQQRSWPTYDQVSAHVLIADYHEILNSTIDLHTSATNNNNNNNNNKTKQLCPHGVVAQVRLEFFDFSDDTTNNTNARPYTGLLSPGTTVEYGLIRLSSALRPVDHGGGSWAKIVARRTFGPKLAASQILPAAALKVFRNNHQPSGNMLFMGSKIGQASRNFFEHALCTAVTEKIPSLGIPFLRRFSRYSKYPLSLGLSEVCKYNVNGDEADTNEHTFPFALCLLPVVDWSALVLANNNSSSSSSSSSRASSNDDNGNNYTNSDNEKEVPFDTFIDDIPRYVPAGTHLFDIYAAPTPESIGASDQLQRIGKVVTTSAFVYSSPTDGLTFRHQAKEDDLELEPTWEDRMNSTTVCMASDKSVEGSVAKMTGWHIFEENILERGDFVDFEVPKEGHTMKKSTRSVNLASPSALQIPGYNFCGYRKVSVGLSWVSIKQFEEVGWAALV